MIHRLDRAEARAIAVRAQLLGACRPGNLLDVVRRLTLLQIDPAAIGQPFDGRTALLSPFDRLLHDRRRAEELFGFEYQLEMYKPPAKRRWGYFALPVLHHDRLVGKLDATADRKAGRFVVHALHEDVPFTTDMRDAVQEEIERLAAWLGLALGEDGQGARRPDELT